MSPEIRRVLDKLAAVKPLAGGWIARCPAHQDGRPSLKIDLADDGRVLLNCYAGCNAKAIVDAIGLELADLFPPSGPEERPKKLVKTATYEVRNEAGTLVAYHVREDYDDGSKVVKWRRASGQWGLGGVPLSALPLYGVHQLGRAGGVVVTEGEKARDALWRHKIAAVGTVTGAETCPGEDALRPLVGRLVVLWPDRDAVGDKHMSRVAATLAQLGQPRERIRQLNWMNAPPGGDAADWVEDADALRDLIDAAEPWPFSASGAQDPDDPPEAPGGDPRAGAPALARFDAGRDDYAALAPLVWEALACANEPPVMFNFHGSAIRLDRDGDRLVPKALDEGRLLYELARAAHWYRHPRGKKGAAEVDSSPRLALARDLLAARSYPLPSLDRVVSCPVFGADGSLQTEAGYHAPSRTYYAGGLALNAVPERPTAADVSEALDWVLKELLVDFPFVGDGDLAHALGELVLPFVRAMIPGPCPLHVHEAPTQGTGKDLLAEAMCRVATDADPATLTYSERSEEFGKRLVATLRPMPEWVVVPNVSGVVDNDDLADLVSRGEHHGRLLGVSEMLRLPARNVWTLTSNNAQLTADMVRRAVRVRIDARMERPETRTRFRHPELKDWASAHRSELVRACLVIVRSWVAAGMPAGTETLGGFGYWSRVIGGIVAHIGCNGFLTDRQEFIAQADSGSAGERALVSLWWEKFGPTPVGLAALYPLAIDEDVNLDIDAPTQRGMQTKLGIRLARMRDRRYRVATGDVVAVGDTGSAHHGKLWKLTREVPHGS